MMKKSRSESVGSEASALKSLSSRGKKRDSHGEIRGKTKSPRNIIALEWSGIYDEVIVKNFKTLVEIMADHFIEVVGKLVNHQTLLKTVKRIESYYNDNHYHKFEHACHVTLNCAYMLKQVNPTLMLSPIEKLSLLYAALIHDTGHLGVPNITLINDMHPLAQKFHDQSVAEMNSLTLGLELIEEAGYDILEKFSSEDKMNFRKNVIEIVLNTDVADTYKKRLMFVKLDDFSDEEQGLNTSTPQGKLVLLCLIMRTSDIGSGLQSHDTFKQWARNFFLEMTLASRDPIEKVRNEKAKYHSTQIVFMESHSFALVVRLQASQAMKPEFTDLLVRNFQANLSYWRENGMVLLDNWVELSEEVIKVHQGSTVYDRDLAKNLASGALM